MNVQDRNNLALFIKFMVTIYNVKLVRQDLVRNLRIPIRKAEMMEILFHIRNNTRKQKLDEMSKDLDSSDIIRELLD